MKNKLFNTVYFKTLALALAAIIPFLIIVSSMLILPQTFERTFLGELADKYERLCTVEGEKMVVIGGSSVAFGLDSDMLEELVGMPVVNFGLYATLGTKLMLDLARDEIKEGDVVVLAPELDSQTLSLYFNAEATWQALDSDMSMLWKLDRDNASDMIGGAVDYVASKFGYLGTTLDPEGIYNHASFDEYGDIVYARPYNVMTFGYDLNKPLSFDPSQYSEEFIVYLNEFISDCEDAGARVCYTFPPMNEGAVPAGTDAETFETLYDFLCENINCEIIGSAENYIMESRYFYDSNFHPNTAGAAHHTAHLAKDLCRFLGITEYYTLELPEPEEKPIIEGGSSADDGVWGALFTYEEKLDGEGNILGYAVSGTAEEANSMSSLEIPRMHNGYPVMEIGQGAFSDASALRSLTIRDNIVSIVSGAFADCPTLEDIHIYNENESTMSVDQNNLFEGASANITIWLYSETSFQSYVTGYFWANYGSMMKPGY